MFGSESCLHGLYKLTHGTRNIAEQIAYWYTIHRSVHSMSIQGQSNVILRDYLMDDYIDESIVQKYNQEFKNLFYVKFSCSSNNSIFIRSRYKKGLIVYHSISYSFRKRSSSFNVCINNTNCSKKKCFGEIIFFFSYQNELFLFLSFHPCSQSHLFSSVIPVDEHLPLWSQYVDHFYYLVDATVNRFCILSCTALLSKCFFFPFCDNRFIVCTPLDNELEHD
jgi:hypothetical protein